jgi:glycosyltransferase involved in cell wall biosynthesis
MLIPQKPKAMEISSSSLLIVVTARLKPAKLQRNLSLLIACLESIVVSIQFSKEKHQSEWRTITLLVVDDYSSPPLNTLMPPHLAEYLLIVANEAAPGQGGALNYALSKFVADVYAFTDSDCIVAPDWISALAMYYAYEKSEIGVTGPNWLFSGSSKGWRRFITQQESNMMKFIMLSYLNEDRTRSARLDCRNLSFRREFIDALPHGSEFFDTNGLSVSAQTSYRFRPVPSTSSFFIGFSQQLCTYHAPVRSLHDQVRIYFLRGYRSNFNRIYAANGGSLIFIFFSRYFVRHFISPWRTGKTCLLYVILVHSAYWMGIMIKQVKDVLLLTGEVFPW